LGVARRASSRTVLPEGGAAVLESELLPSLVVAAQSQAGANSRPTTRRKACWAKIAGDEVIEKGEFAGRYLQLVRVVGTELEIDGQDNLRGRHPPRARHAADAELLRLSRGGGDCPHAQGAHSSARPSRFEGFEEIWETANQRPHVLTSRTIRTHRLRRLSA
jgi:hypothetical protein